ncbi:hypothetical protein HZC34_04765 [Candidatus Saganbacteria bacterium]|nr:hypothetical protein [Candidatus Saganbacteria bacterium]
MLELYNRLKKIAETEYKEIIDHAEFIHKRTIGSAKLRIFIKNHSFLDIWLSESGKYSYHWEDRAQTGKIYRYDNAPDFPKIKTFPKHIHYGDEKTIKQSSLSDNPQEAIREILKFIKDNIA